MLTAGLFLVPWASDFASMLVVIGAVAASAGILSPILTYWISAKAGSVQGWELGKQTAAASLGGTVGSAAGGLLFNIAHLAWRPLRPDRGPCRTGLPAKPRTASFTRAP